MQPWTYRKASVRLAVVNPTAVNGKIERFLQLKANVLAISETSATTVVQKESTREFSRKEYRSFWSQPAAPKKSANDLRPSYRGEAVGSAVICNLPRRQARHEVPEALWETRLGNIEVLMIAVYGFANRHKEGIRPNDILLASLIPVIVSTGLPYIVAGDFNEPLENFQLISSSSMMGLLSPSSYIVPDFALICQPHAVAQLETTLSSCIPALQNMLSIWLLGPNINSMCIHRFSWILISAVINLQN